MNVPILTCAIIDDEIVATDRSMEIPAVQNPNHLIEELKLSGELLPAE